MNKTWLRQVFKMATNLLWIEESVELDFEQSKIHLRDGWIYSLYKYKDKSVKNAIWQMKYRANRNIARFFGREMADFIDTAKFGRSANLEKYILVPIPIHFRRRFERGFNQTEWLCEAIKNSSEERGHCQISYKKILKRIQYSKKQSWSTKFFRQENIKSVFKVRKKFAREIYGQNFLLIDDIVTTGSTLNEARDELLHCGASSVQALTIAY